MKAKYVVLLMTIFLLTLAPTTMSQEAITLRVQHWSDTMTHESEWWGEVIAGFEAAHPGVTIENNFIPFPQYLTTLEAMIAGEELPDVFWGHVKVAEMGRGDLIVSYTEVMDEEFLGRFMPSPMRQFTFDGNVYAIPWNAQMFGFFYDPAILAELGIEPAATWDELIEMAPGILEAGYIPLAWGNAAGNVCTDFFLPLVAQYGGDVYALDDLSDPAVSWDSEPVVNALALLQRLAENDLFLPGINGVTQEQGAQIFFQGRAAFFYGHSNYPGIIAAQAPQELVDTYEVTKIPAVAEGDIPYSGDGSGNGWVVKNNAPNTELGLEFVRYIMSEEVYGDVITASRNVPSMPWAMDFVEDRHVAEMTSWIETDGANHILFGTGSWDGVTGVCASILDGSTTPEEGAATIQANVLAARAR